MAEFPVTELFNNVRGLFPDKTKRVTIDNWAFRLHTRFHSTFILGASFVIFVQQMFGESISCVVPASDESIPVQPLNRYCFITGTYTLPHLYEREIGTDIAHFGVGPSEGRTDDEKKYHVYFQWVPYVLFIQGVLTVLPHLLWKAVEGGKVSRHCEMKIIEDIKLNSRTIISVGDRKEKEQLKVSEAAQEYVDQLSKRNLFGYWFFLLECLNLLINLFNFYTIDFFLNGDFSNYGSKWLRHTFYPGSEPYNPMDSVFPKMTKCDFNKYGPSGNIVTYDVLCVLTLNIINEKIYLMIWFFSVTLFLVSGVALFYRLLVIVNIKSIRSRILARKAAQHDNFVVEATVHNLHYSDWFLLSSISSNLSCRRFGELCQQINTCLKAVQLQAKKKYDIECGTDDEDEENDESSKLATTDPEKFEMKRRRKNSKHLEDTDD